MTAAKCRKWFLPEGRKSFWESARLCEIVLAASKPSADLFSRSAAFPARRAQPYWRFPGAGALSLSAFNRCISAGSRAQSMLFSGGAPYSSG